MDDNQLLETPTRKIMVAAEAGEIANWNDAKKVEFVGLFQNRVRAARYILAMTAHLMAQKAEHRKFVSQKHLGKIFERHNHFDISPFLDPGCKRWESPHTVGGRDPKALDEIAEARADAVLDELPPLKQAVQIIDPDTAAKIERKEKLLKIGENLKDQVEEVSEPIVMADLDQKMTIADFRKLVKETDKKRRQLLEKLNEVGQEGSQLESSIAKRLYSGLPGLSQAVVDVIESHLDRATALDEVSRRVEEQVKFGDSEAALGLLRHFEKDEAEVSGKVKTQFAEALEKLKLSVKRANKRAKAAKAAMGA